MSQNTSTAVMQRRVEPDDSLEDFPTPSWATRAVIEKIIMPLTFPGQIRSWTAREPCANRGYMARPLAEYFGQVRCSDIFDYGMNYLVEDYLFPGSMTPANWTFFNPPFRLALQFILKSFDTPGWVGTACIARSAFLEGKDRYENLFSFQPPTIVAQHVERVIMTKGIVRDPAKEYWDPNANGGKGKMKRPSTATSYCWLIWMRDPKWEGTRMMWIQQCRKQLERPGDYPE